MATSRRKSVALVLECRSLETRLAPSGNFLSHGYADAVRAVDGLEHHHHAEHSTMTGESARTEALTVHYDHVMAHVAK